MNQREGYQVTNGPSCQYEKYAHDPVTSPGLGLEIGNDLVQAAGGVFKISKEAVPVVQVGAGPRDFEPVEPSDSELGLEALAEASFRLRIEVNATGDFHR